MNKFEKKGANAEERESLKKKIVKEAALLLAQHEVDEKQAGNFPGNFQKNIEATDYFQDTAVAQRKAEGYEKGLSYFFDTVEDMVISSDNSAQALVDFYLAEKQKLAKAA